MEYYREYPIRCKTCNELIASRINEFEELMSIERNAEKVLNEMGIMNYCTRINFLNPIIVVFNMENREVIEGLKTIDAITEDDYYQQEKSEMEVKVVVPNIPKVIQPLPIQERKGLIIGQIGRGKIALGGKEEVKPLVVNIEQSQGIKITLPQRKEGFQEPTKVGVPTHNPNDNLELIKVNVGADKYTNIINGRTYLAR